LSNLKLLYIEDDIDTSEELLVIFNILKLDVLHAANYNEAVELYKNNNFDLIISDIELSSKRNGIDFIKEVRTADDNIPIIITSAYSDTSYMLDSIELNIVRYLIKPIIIDNLKDAIKKAIAILNDDNITLFQHNFQYDSKNKYFTKDNKVIKITNQEIILIELLIANQKNIVPFHNLQYALSQDHEVSIDSLRTTIKKLRQNTYKEIIESISKIGYRLN